MYKTKDKNFTDREASKYIGNLLLQFVLCNLYSARKAKDQFFEGAHTCAQTSTLLRPGELF